MGLFEPMAFEKDERNLGTRLITVPVSAEAVVMPRSDLWRPACQLETLIRQYGASHNERLHATREDARVMRGFRAKQK
jgi:hypothetical protein